MNHDQNRYPRQRSQKDLQKTPNFIVSKLKYWIVQIEIEGLESARLNRGFHDEPLHGVRLGQRSVRLNRAYRAIYEIKKNGTTEFVLVKEVHKHDY